MCFGSATTHTKLKCRPEETLGVIFSQCTSGTTQFVVPYSVHMMACSTSSKENLNFSSLTWMVTMTHSRLTLKRCDFQDWPNHCINLLWTKFLFGTKIKSRYQNVLGNTKILSLSVKQGSQCPIQLLGPRRKWVDFPPMFFQFFIIFLVVCHLLLNIKKKMLWHFSSLARYGPFWLQTWSKIKNFYFH